MGGSEPRAYASMTNLSEVKNSPQVWQKCLDKCEEVGFTMPSDIYIGSFLRSLISSKPSSSILELGTGIGLSLGWMIDGLDQNSTLISIDNDQKLIDHVIEMFPSDYRVSILCEDGGEWLDEYQGDKFDLIFADTWRGKYTHLDRVLELLKCGGMYVIDDMRRQPNWPEGHAEKADALVEELEKRPDLVITKMDWSTGVILCTKTC